MASVIDHRGNEIALRDCECGAEPDYHSATGVAHEIVCRSCGRQTDMEICGLDAVHEWNSGTVYLAALYAPIRSKHPPTPSAESASAARGEEG